MEEIKEDQRPSLKRALFMILFLIISRFIAIAIWFIAIFQFIYALIFGKPNENVLEFTKSLSEYIKQIVAYVSFNTESAPWPLGGIWPKE